MTVDFIPTSCACFALGGAKLKRMTAVCASMAAPKPLPRSEGELETTAHVSNVAGLDGSGRCLIVHTLLTLAAAASGVPSCEAPNECVNGRCGTPSWTGLLLMFAHRSTCCMPPTSTPPGKPGPFTKPSLSPWSLELTQNE
eukprot:7057015-Prymnesium_polylepis.1